MIQNIINRLVRDFPILNSEEITNSLKEAIANDRIGGRNMFLILRCISNISYDKLGDLIRFYTARTASGSGGQYGIFGEFYIEQIS
jgi:hypothetical protein